MNRHGEGRLVLTLDQMISPEKLHQVSPRCIHCVSRAIWFH